MFNKNLRKKLGILCVSLAMTGLYACGKTGDSKSKEEATVKTVTEATSTEAKSEEENTTEEESGITQEKYDSMTEDELLEALGITDLENVTEEQYLALVQTLKFVPIVDDDRIDSLYIDNNITKKAISKVKKGLPSVDTIIEKIIKDEAPQVRGYAYQSMFSFFGVKDKSVALAKENLETETNDYVLKAAVDALSNEMAKDPFVAEFIFKMSKHENPKIRYKAAMAIGNSWSIGVDGTVDRIIEMMDDENQDVRKMACYEAGKLNDEKVIDRLVEILNDPNEKADLKGKCINGLATLWYDYPFHKNTSERAYRETINYWSKTPRDNDNPEWSSILVLNNKSETSYPEWREKATYFSEDEIYNVFVDVIKDENANWLARQGVIKAIHTHCSAEKFAELKDVVYGLTDGKAEMIQKEYDNEALK